MAADNRGPELQAVCSTFVSLAFTAVLLRIYVRLRIVKAFGWDDAWMIGAMLGHIMFATCAIGGVHYGTGQHMSTLTAEQIYKALRYWWLCYIAYCVTMICVKISIGIFLLRVTVSRLQRWTIYIALTFSVITGTLFFFVTLLQCSPISYFWNRMQPGSCISVDVIIGLTYMYSAVNAVCDFTLGILPVFLVKGLNMERRVKYMLIPLLSMAGVASTAVLVRLAYIPKFRGNDFLYDTLDIAIWSDTEQGLAIIAGSLATLRPLYRLLSERLGWSRSGTDQKPSRQTPHTKTTIWSPPHKRSNRFKNLSSFNRTSERSSDEEYNLRNVRPIQLRDDLVDDFSHERKEEGFQSWRVEVGDRGEEEAGRRSIGGITKVTDVYMMKSLGEGGNGHY